MEATIVYWGNLGVYLGIVDKKMESILQYIRVINWDHGNVNLQNPKP